MMAKVFITFMLNFYFVFSLTEKELNWQNFMTHAKQSTNILTSYVQPILSDIFSKEPNVSGQCAESLLRYMNGLNNWEHWAIQMLDATSKVPTGFLSGTKIDFGSFEQCLKIRASEVENYSSFRGRFCMVHIETPLIKPMKWKTSRNASYIETYGHPPEWIYSMMKEQQGILSTFGLYMGVCFPSSCSQDDILNLLTQVAKPKALEVAISDCQTDEPKEWPTSAVVACYVILGQVVICIIGTILDVRNVRHIERGQKLEYESSTRKVMKAFSLYTNTKTLFEVPKYKSYIDSFYGLRAYSCVSVVFVHTFLFPSRWKENKYSNWNRVFELVTVPGILIENSLMFIETFFVMSGFFFAYTTWRTLEKSNGKINVFRFIMQKYCRLMPAQIFMILYSFILPVLYNGPIWNSTWEEEISRCENFGWRNIFLIHNLFPMKDLCWLHTWYLGVLMQIQILSLVLLILTYRNPKKGILLSLLCVGACFMYDFIVSYQNEYLFPTLYSMKSFDMIRDYTSKIYIKPFNHLFSYLVGMLLGWYVLKFKNHRLNSVQHTFGWILYSIFSLLVLYVIWFPTDNVLITSIHNASRNWVFSLCFSWVIYITSTGRIETLSRILSAKVFIPFSHISYFVYLMHAVSIVFKEASLRTKTHMGYLEHIYDFIAHVVTSLVLAFIAYLIVEAPFNKLYDLWQASGSSSASVKDSTKKLLSENGKNDLIKAKSNLAHGECYTVNGNSNLVNIKDHVINGNSHMLNEKDHVVNGEGNMVNGEGNIVNRNEHIVNGNDHIVNGNDHLINVKKYS